MSYLVTGLAIEQFEPLFGRSEADLAGRDIVRITVDASSGYPCRISLEDAQPGETVLLLNYEHQPAPTPFRSRHAIYVREAARETCRETDRLPKQLASRLLSIRAFDASGMMVDAGVTQGVDADALIDRLLGLPGVAYLHAHFAAHGCYAARIERS